MQIKDKAGNPLASDYIYTFNVVVGILTYLLIFLGIVLLVIFIFGVYMYFYIYYGLGISKG